MANWFIQPEIVAATIAGGVSLIIAIGGHIVTRQRNNSENKRRQHELNKQADQKKKELDELTKNRVQDLERIVTEFRVEQNLAQQVQLTEILKKRMETYPALYEIIALYGRNW